MNITELSSRVTREAPNCPGGVGNFGFNSYDLMTFGLLAMGAVSSAVIINTNKNENNNNNNDLQASIGGLTTNVQMSSADQTTTQMATITVPPTGVPGKKMIEILLFIFCSAICLFHESAPFCLLFYSGRTCWQIIF